MKNQWKSASFRKTGLRHSESSESCQDYVLLDGHKGASLSDGISSGLDSEIASQYASEQAIAVCREISRRENLINASSVKSKEFCYAIAKKISERINSQLKAYPNADATLVFAYFISDQYLLLGYIGDSAIIVFTEQDAKVYTQTRDYGSAATESIHHPRAADLMLIQILDLNKEHVKAIMLTSDGLEDELYIKHSNRALKACEKYVNALFDANGEDIIEKYLDELISSGIFDDDISLAILAREKISLHEEPMWLCKCGNHNPVLRTYCLHCGEDYFNLYRNVDMSRFSSPWEFFSYMNENPEEERQIICYTEKVSNSISSSCESQTKKDTIKGKRSFDSQDKNNRRLSREAGFRMKPNSQCLAIAALTVCAMLCGILVVNFFLVLSLSKDVQTIKSDIINLREERISSTESNLNQLETISETEQSTETESQTDPPQNYTESTTYYLSVSEYTVLYSEPSLSSEQIGAVLPDDHHVVLISKQIVDGQEWLNVQSSSGDSGWALSEFFVIIQQDETLPSYETSISPSEVE